MENYVSKFISTWFKFMHVLCNFLAFGLDYYTEVLSLDYLLEHISDTPFSEKNKALKKAVVELIEDYSLVSFIPMSVQVNYHIAS